ncbi:hypothetical protein ASPVEDRAFT_42597, partial [Aspergillus versicolor CBS 583.65]
MAHETTPLLHPGKHNHQAHWILILLCIVIVTIDFGSALSAAPQTQILEDIVCRALHRDAVISASTCKGADVQSELALINGWKETFDQIPGIIIALPYGFMADRVGRKQVAMLSMLGLTLQEVAVRIICWHSPTISPRAIWFTSVFQLCGGGAQIASSMVFTIMSDIFPVDKRTNKFFMLQAAMLVTEIVGSPISAWLMTISSPWLPYLLGLFCEFLALTAFLAIPETLPGKLDSDYSHTADDTNRAENKRVRVIKLATTQMLRVKQLIWGNRNVLAITAAFFSATAGIQAKGLVLQFASKKFSWSMGEASLLFSLKGIINLVLLLAILPALSEQLQTRFGPARRDLLIAQGSALFPVFGFTLMGFASHPALFSTGMTILALGSGFYAALRSLASSLVPETQAGLLNTTIGLVQGVGGMVAGPALAGAFSYGMKLGGPWIGLPYFVAAVLFTGAGLGICGVTLSNAPDDGFV